MTRRPDRAILEAAARYQGFSGEEAAYLDELELSGVAFKVGEVLGISYAVVENGRRVIYHHDYERPPCLAITHDGRNALILAGGWRFTDRGFVG